MPHLRLVAIAGAVVLVAAVALGIVLTNDPETPDQAEVADCGRGSSPVLRALVDDRSVLPADNWVPVVRVAGSYRDRLSRLDQVSRLISPEDVTAVTAARRADRRAAIRQGVADVPRAAGGRSFRVTISEGEASRSVGQLYEAALERLGSRTTVRTVPVQEALDAVESGDADTAVVGLASLAGAVEASLEEAVDASTQVQVIATAALDRRLALGATSAATSTPQVLVPDDIVVRFGLATLSDLASVCGNAMVAATAGAESAAQDLADGYGLQVTDDDVADPAAAFESDDSVVAVVVAAG